MSETPQRPELRIAAAAIRLDNDLVVSLPPPARHHDLVRLLAEVGVRQDTHFRSFDQQGFILNTGQYVRRRPAKHIAFKAGQLVARAMDLDELYSEDVW